MCLRVEETALEEHVVEQHQIDGAADGAAQELFEPRKAVATGGDLLFEANNLFRLAKGGVKQNEIIEAWLRQLLNSHKEFSVRQRRMSVRFLTLLVGAGIQQDKILAEFVAHLERNETDNLEIRRKLIQSLVSAFLAGRIPADKSIGKKTVHVIDRQLRNATLPSFVFQELLSTMVSLATRGGDSLGVVVAEKLLEHFSPEGPHVTPARRSAIAKTLISLATKNVQTKFIVGKVLELVRRGGRAPVQRFLDDLPPGGGKVVEEALNQLAEDAGHDQRGRIMTTFWQYFHGVQKELARSRRRANRRQRRSRQSRGEEEA